MLIAGCTGSGADNSNLADADSGVPEYTDANTALAEGTKFLDADEIDKAIAALNQAVRLNPDLAEAYFNLGVAYALVEMRDALNLEASPDSSDDSDSKKKPNSQIAFEKAAEAYKKVVEAEPENHQAHFRLGLAYNKLNKDQEAARAFRQAVKLNPEDTLYQKELGKILIKLAQYREAIGPLKKALELDPENVEAEELLADAEAGRSRVDYVSVKKDTNSASNSNTAEQTGPESNSKTATKPDTKPDVKPSPSAPQPRTGRTPSTSNRP